MARKNTLGKQKYWITKCKFAHTLLFNSRWNRKQHKLRYVDSAATIHAMKSKFKRFFFWMMDVRYTLAKSMMELWYCENTSLAHVMIKNVLFVPGLDGSLISVKLNSKTKDVSLWEIQASRSYVYKLNIGHTANKVKNETRSIHI